MAKKIQEARRKAMKTHHAEQADEKKQTLVVVAALFPMVVAQPSHELPRPLPIEPYHLDFATVCCPLMSWPNPFCR